MCTLYTPCPSVPPQCHSLGKPSTHSTHLSSLTRVAWSICAVFSSMASFSVILTPITSPQPPNDIRMKEIRPLPQWKTHWSYCTPPSPLEKEILFFLSIRLQRWGDVEFDGCVSMCSIISQAMGANQPKYCCCVGWWEAEQLFASIFLEVGSICFWMWRPWKVIQEKWYGQMTWLIFIPFLSISFLRCIWALPRPQLGRQKAQGLDNSVN